MTSPRSELRSAAFAAPQGAARPWGGPAGARTSPRSELRSAAFAAPRGAGDLGAARRSPVTSPRSNLRLPPPQGAARPWGGPAGARTSPRSARCAPLTRTVARPASRPRGFTLVELLVALALLALLSATLFGALALSGRSWDAGEAKAAETSSMRTAQDFLRSQLERQHGQRMKRIEGWPLLFTGEREEVRFAATLPARVQGGGIWYFRLHVAEVDGKPSLVLDRMVPDVTGAALPDFGGAEHSVLATGIRSVTIAYLGLDPGASATGGFEPAWRDQWQDTQRLPQLIRIDVETDRGTKWPTLYAAPRESPEAGCRAWNEARARCAQG